ncbi:MAG TPA: hypothetical protein VHA52_03895 [Candidatus Babeliaceae bacterium]|nr:hypothetical protein [Candidatus Babeliaceae bacterium]
MTPQSLATFETKRFKYEALGKSRFFSPEELMDIDDSAFKTDKFFDI